MKDALNKIIGTLLYRNYVIVSIVAKSDHGIDKAFKMAEIVQDRVWDLQ